MTKTKLTFVALFSCGWLAPLDFAYSLYVHYLDLLRQEAVFSFPFLDTSAIFFLSPVSG
jgi:hypothetical protein